AMATRSSGLRVVVSRTGVVLGRNGGALAQMLPPFRLGLGGPIGSGRQYLPWIHQRDLVEFITAALVDDRYHGPVNGVAPQETTSRTFAAALGRALHRPALVPAPAFALKLDRKSTRLNSSHVAISYAVFCLKKKKNTT